MPDIRAKVRVGEDHSITGLAPEDVPAGEHEVLITFHSPPIKQTWRAADLPKHDLPWDGSISLRREDLYGDDGR